ncbi:hypothetical protein F5B17DRAFT_423564 [Nemania serpens]|nr:hypothetical protein F5B17DRAFT_423564 [Nemania serpens]
MDDDDEEEEEEGAGGGLPIARAATVEAGLGIADVEDVYEEPPLMGNANADLEESQPGNLALSAAEARYREFVAQRVGDAPTHASPFGVRFPAARRSSTDRLFSESSWSSSSSSSASSDGEEFDDSDDVDDGLDDFRAYGYHLYNEELPEPTGDDNSENNNNDTVETSKTDKNDEDEETYIVSHRDNLLDSVLRGELRRIARALNFMVRARASGIDVGDSDVDALAAVEPER